MIQKSGNTDLVLDRPVCSIPSAWDVAAILACNIPEHGASCLPVSPGGVKPISTSSVTELSPNLPRYVLATINFHQQTTV